MHEYKCQIVCCSQQTVKPHKPTMFNPKNKKYLRYPVLLKRPKNQLAKICLVAKFSLNPCDMSGGDICSHFSYK